MWITQGILRLHGRKNSIHDCNHSNIRPCVSVNLPGRTSHCGSPPAHLQPKAKYHHLHPTRERCNDFHCWATLETPSPDGETSAAWVLSLVHLMEGFMSCLAPVITTEAHLERAGSGIHSNNTAELSSVVEAFSLLGRHGPVARDSRSCIFYDSKHRQYLLGHSPITGQHPARSRMFVFFFLRTQLRPRFTMHNYTASLHHFSERPD